MSELVDGEQLNEEVDGSTEGPGAEDVLHDLQVENAACKDSVVDTIRAMSKFHGQLWDNLEDLLGTNAEDLSYEVTHNGAKCQGIVTLWGCNVVHLRKLFESAVEAEEYVKEYVDHIKAKAAGGEGTRG